MPIPKLNLLFLLWEENMSSKSALMPFISLENFNKSSFALLKLHHHLLINGFSKPLFTLFFNPILILLHALDFSHKYNFFIILLIIFLKMFPFLSFIQHIFIGTLSGLNWTLHIQWRKKTKHGPCFQRERQTVIKLM